MNLIIATPFYEGHAFTNYIQSLLLTTRELANRNINWDWMRIEGDAYVDRAKNAIVAMFLENKDATDLFLIDSDMGWDVAGFFRVLDAKEDIVGTTYPMKGGGNSNFNAAIHVNNPKDRIPEVNENGLISAEWVPGGFTRFKRSALVKMTMWYREEWYLNEDSGHKGKTVALFECPRHNNQRFGEDVEFCRKWRLMGGKLWLEPNVSFTHRGAAEWVGNYHEFLCNRKSRKSIESRLDNTLNRGHDDSTPVDPILVEAA